MLPAPAGDAGQAEGPGVCGRRPGSPTSAQMASSGSPLARGVGPGFLSALSWVAAWARGKGGGPSLPAGARAARTRGARTSRATLRSAWHGLGSLLLKRRLLPESQSLRCPPRSAGTASPGRAREGVADSGEAAQGRAGYLQATFSAPWREPRVGTGTRISRSRGCQLRRGTTGCRQIQRWTQ